jgi:hypothetical protein
MSQGAWVHVHRFSGLRETGWGSGHATPWQGSRCVLSQGVSLAVDFLFVGLEVGRLLYKAALKASLGQFRWEGRCLGADLPFHLRRSMTFL